MSRRQCGGSSVLAHMHTQISKYMCMHETLLKDEETANSGYSEECSWESKRSLGFFL